MKALLIKDTKTMLAPAAVFLLLDAMLVTVQWEDFKQGNILLLLCMPIIAIYVVFAKEEGSGWNKYVNALPYTEKEIVGEKYILSAVLIAAMEFTILFFGSITPLLLGTYAAYFEVLSVAATSVLFVCFTTAIFIPCTVSFGVMKGIAVSVFFCVLVMMPIFYACYSSIDHNITYFYGGAYTYQKFVGITTASAMILMFWLCNAFGFISMFLSYHASLRFFKKRDY